MTNPMTSLAKPLSALIGGPPDLSILGMYRKLAALPAGKTLFTKAVCLKAPYFGTIEPHIEELRAGYCEVHIKDRRVDGRRAGDPGQRVADCASRPRQDAAQVGEHILEHERQQRLVFDHENLHALDHGTGR